MDDKPKALKFGGEEHNAPLVDISHLSEKEKAQLKSKALSAIGTYSYDVFKSDEEFELTLACLTPYYWGNPESTTEDDIAAYTDYHRGFYYHKKKFRVWEKEVLGPMVKDLADYALDAPHYDASFLLTLEMRKMQCMDAYFSHSVTADENGNKSTGIKPTASTATSANTPSIPGGTDLESMICNFQKDLCLTTCDVRPSFPNKFCKFAVKNRL